jgi:ubiquinone/menaquinone biosynthesis C-methylase UbiE
MIERSLGLSPGIRVLDIPCGAGRHAREFARRGWPTTAIDLSRDLLDHATHSGAAPNLSYARGDVRALPLRDGSFDVVANLFSSFGYLPDDEANFAVLGEFARVCRPGGHVVLDFMNEPQVRLALQPDSERMTSEGWVVSERRSIRGTPPRVEKQTRVTVPSGGTREFLESVRLFKPEELREAMERAALVVCKAFGDYSGAEYSAQSRRLILIGEKP